ncbi:YqcC family protein [Vibrio kasasachensis]|uniref:YqcC family protein n=1 Tax=Vibrio kasasachensis TaxID=2910248 RepID=UPI003D0E2A9D
MKHDIPLKVLLDELEQQLRDTKLWQDTPPLPQLLTSEQPFALDTLEPQQWLQWIFLPRMRMLIEAKKTLPKGFAIAPYFDECWQHKKELSTLLVVIRQIDQEGA